MQKRNEALQSLHEAVKVSPDNIPLRQHFADTLMGKGLYEDAEKEYRAALSYAPDNEQLKLGLANAFFKLNKKSAALVVLEDLLESPGAPPRAHLLYARLLLKSGEKANAVEEYRKALQLDPSLADPTLAEQLGYVDDFETQEDFEEELFPMPSEMPDEAIEIEMERPESDFSQVGGMEKLKEEIRMKIIHPLTHPEIYEAYGKPIGGGILMYGPPGCGKTHLARATAGEVKAGFISIGIHDVLDMWIGNSERNLHELFEFARERKPCVLFFDEVDALGASRSDMRRSGNRQLINQFLAELDGFNVSNDGLLILAATNAPWHLDPAFRRPGRFDRVLFVPPPDFEARAEILRILLQGKPLDDIDYEFLAKKTDGFSGADLKAAIDVAIEDKLQSALQKGTPEPLTTKDLQKALKSLKATTNEWFSTARNYALYANQGGIYDDIAKYLKL
ncbi:MAG: AAA family ATPase [bacterium]